MGLSSKSNSRNCSKKIHFHLDSPPNKKDSTKTIPLACATQKAYKNMVVSRPSGFKSGKKAVQVRHQNKQIAKLDYETTAIEQTGTIFKFVPDWNPGEKESSILNVETSNRTTEKS